MPSFILIHPTIWPQCTDVADILLPRVQTSTGQRSFAYSGPSVEQSAPSLARKHPTGYI